MIGPEEAPELRVEDVLCDHSVMRIISFKQSLLFNG